mmetsp:Transcript_41835/g.67310  ORF Transcript_41835/g.67310 Transcript_41835/m.67310 type:complete len:266 (-) Transcript_41835:173-970(-)
MAKATWDCNSSCHERMTPFCICLPPLPIPYGFGLAAFLSSLATISGVILSLGAAEKMSIALWNVIDLSSSMFSRAINTCSGVLTWYCLLVAAVFFFPELISLFLFLVLLVITLLLVAFFWSSYCCPIEVVPALFFPFFSFLVTILVLLVVAAVVFIVVVEATAAASFCCAGEEGESSVASVTTTFKVVAPAIAALLVVVAAVKASSSSAGTPNLDSASIVCCRSESRVFVSFFAAFKRLLTRECRFCSGHLAFDSDRPHNNPAKD